MAEETINPTCETCRWFVVPEPYDDDDLSGLCFLNPPSIHEPFASNALDDSLICAPATRPEVGRFEFCSKHNEPTHKDQVLRYTIGARKT